MNKEKFKELVEQTFECLKILHYDEDDAFIYKILFKVLSTEIESLGPDLPEEELEAIAMKWDPFVVDIKRGGRGSDTSNIDFNKVYRRTSPLQQPHHSDFWEDWGDVGMRSDGGGVIFNPPDNNIYSAGSFGEHEANLPNENEWWVEQEGKSNLEPPMQQIRYGVPILRAGKSKEKEQKSINADYTHEEDFEWFVAEKCPLCDYGILKLETHIDELRANPGPFLYHLFCDMCQESFINQTVTGSSDWAKEYRADMEKNFEKLKRSLKKEYEKY